MRRQELNFGHVSAMNIDESRTGYRKSRDLHGAVSDDVISGEHVTLVGSR